MSGTSGKGRDGGPIHVVHIVESLGSGGAERALYNALRHLDPARIHSTVVSVNDQATLWLEPIRRLGIEVDSLAIRSHRRIPVGVARFRKWLRARQPDLVHTQLFPANIIGRLTAHSLDIAVISTIQSIEYAQDSWQGGSLPIKRVLARAVDGWTARRSCERLIAISSAVRTSAHEQLRYPMDRIDIIPNGVELTDVDDPAPPGRRSLRDELGLDSSALILLNVGRVVLEKGLNYAIPAMPRILSAHENVHLVSVGATTDHAWLSRLERMVNDHGVRQQVHFLGERQDIPDLLRECDVFLFPSIVEGLGVALLEAMAAGCACIASRIPSLSEFIVHGSNGWLVPPKDSDLLAEAVIDLLGRPAERERVRAAAMETVRRDFSAQSVAVRLTELYQAVVEAVDR